MCRAAGDPEATWDPEVALAHARDDPLDPFSDWANANELPDLAMTANQPDLISEPTPLVEW